MFIDRAKIKIKAGDGGIGVAAGVDTTSDAPLAVNANVRLGDPARALAYFERAYTLDQSPSMEVLRACYRARSGRAEEAQVFAEAWRQQAFDGAGAEPASVTADLTTKANESNVNVLRL